MLYVIGIILVVAFIVWCGWCWWSLAEYANHFEGTLQEQDRSTTREVCICAAIRLPDGRVFRGHRHSDIIEMLAKRMDWRFENGLELKPWGAFMASDQGFITSRNRYVGREEAMQLQLAAGVESRAKGGYRGNLLFSEDLY